MLKPKAGVLIGLVGDTMPQEFELAEFKMLHSEEGGERDQGGDRCKLILNLNLHLTPPRFCLTATWFRAWEAWVCGRAKEPPG